MKLIQDPCIGLVSEIENGNLRRDETKLILEKALQPMISAGIDTIVLGCTHYPFVFPLIQEIVGPDVRLIDPAPAIARQVGRLLDMHKLNNGSGRKGKLGIFTTGDPEKFSDFLVDIGYKEKPQSLIWGVQLKK